MRLWQQWELTASLTDNHQLEGYVLSRKVIVDRVNVQISLFKFQQISIQRRLFLAADASSHFLFEAAN